jgi:ribonuclease HII
LTSEQAQDLFRTIIADCIEVLKDFTAAPDREITVWQIGHAQQAAMLSYIAGLSTSPADADLILDEYMVGSNDALRDFVEERMAQARQKMH